MTINKTCQIYLSPPHLDGGCWVRSGTIEWDSRPALCSPDALDPERYPKARAYIENFSGNVLVVFDYWLEGKGWILLTTNAIKSAFSRIVNRIKRVGRRWSEDGLMNWLMLAFRKIYQPQLWG